MSFSHNPWDEGGGFAHFPDEGTEAWRVVLIRPQHAVEPWVQGPPSRDCDLKDQAQYFSRSAVSPRSLSSLFWALASSSLNDV